MILEICNTPKVMEIMNIVVKVIDIIKIVVPIILLFILIFKFIKASTDGNDDAIAQIKKKAIPNVIAAALIFIIPTAINLIVTLAFPDSGFARCIKITPKEEIDKIYVTKMQSLVDKAVESEDITDYITAKNYLVNIDDKDLYNEYDARLEEVKEIIDDTRKALQLFGENTGYGSEVATTEHILVACKWVLHPDDIKIRLYECVNPEHQHADPNAALPGGAISVTIRDQPTYKARKTITFREYQFGLFGGEIDFRFNATFNRMFAILYRNEILASKVWRIINNPSIGEMEEQPYENGSCTQNYRQNLLDERYYSGKYADIIDDAVKSTQYIILIDTDTGKVTDSMYNTKSGIVPVMEKASKSYDIDGILEAMKSGHTLAHRYKTATLYDCRNVLTEDDIAIEAERNGLKYHKKTKK